jgi:hypothetical protein
VGASRLSIYNGALRWLEERKLVNLEEQREPRRYMDDEYDENNLFCIADGNWNFAMRFIKMGPEKAILPNFGFNFCYRKPIDWNHTFQISGNEGFDPLLRQYADQNGYWFANTGLLYVKYISQDPNYGLNTAMWTPAFIQYVEARLAWLCAARLKQKANLLERLDKLVKRVRAEAISTDSQDLPAEKPPYGTWTLSRAPRISYELDDGDLPLPGGAQNQQPPPQVIPVMVTQDGAAIETQDGQWIIPEPG